MERRFPVKEPAAATPYPRDGTVRIAWPGRGGLIYIRYWSFPNALVLHLTTGPLARERDQSFEGSKDQTIRKVIGDRRGHCRKTFAIRPRLPGPMPEAERITTPNRMSCILISTKPIAGRPSLCTHPSMATTI